MKKILSLILALTLLVTAFTFTVSAEAEELTVNGNFEEGDESGWKKEGSCTWEVTDEYAHSGSYGMALMDRGGQYSTVYQDLTDTYIEWGPGKYKGSLWCRLDTEDSTAKGMMVIRITTSSGVKYFTTGYKQLTTSWTEFVFYQTIDVDIDTVSAVAVYPQCFNGSNKGIDIYIDDLTLVKTTEKNGKKVEKINLPEVEMEHLKPTDYTREEVTTVGAIRWDAWYGHDSGDTSILSQVEKSLSPAKYHFRAPFFAQVTDDNKIYIPEYTQEIFDKEMEYAKEAGISYFAYVWYEGSMGKAHNFHKTSKYKNDVKMCVLFDGNAIGKDYARKEMAELLKDDCYMTVLGGRPLMYYFATSSNLTAIGEDIKYYRRLCEYLGIPEPYAVVMNRSAGDHLKVYGDAVSKYAPAASGGIAFNELLQITYDSWETWRKTGAQIVPTMSAGWHNGTRYENQVSWGTVNEDDWVEYATADEIQAEVEYTLRYLQQDGVKEMSMANTALIYAWNEHDEGGWLCPTIAVDENGNQLFESDGTAKINDERIQAVKRAIDKYKNGELNGNMDLTGSSSAPTEVPTVTDSPVLTTENPSNGWVLPVVIGAVAVIVIAGAVIFVLVKKKKSAKAEGTDEQ